MEPTVTLNLRMSVDLFAWLEDEADAASLTPTAAARKLIAKAMEAGVTLK